MEKYTGTKFKTLFVLKKVSPPPAKIKEINQWCQKFAQLDLVPEAGGGFCGNLSFRANNDTFFITASGADLANLNQDDWVLVLNCALAAEEVTVNGQKPPSSETFLHYLIYQNRPDVQVIFHVHDHQVTKNADKYHLPITKQEKPYGTIALANEIIKILNNHNYLVIKNHGVIALGKNIAETGKLILEIHNQ